MQGVHRRTRRPPAPSPFGRTFPNGVTHPSSPRWSRKLSPPYTDHLALMGSSDPITPFPNCTDICSPLPDTNPHYIPSEGRSAGPSSSSLPSWAPTIDRGTSKPIFAPRSGSRGQMGPWSSFWGDHLCNWPVRIKPKGLIPDPIQLPHPPAELMVRVPNMLHSKMPLAFCSFCLRAHPACKAQYGLRNWVPRSHSGSNF